MCWHHPPQEAQPPSDPIWVSHLQEEAARELHALLEEVVSSPMHQCVGTHGRFRSCFVGLSSFVFSGWSMYLVPLIPNHVWGSLEKIPFCSLGLFLFCSNLGFHWLEASQILVFVQFVPSVPLKSIRVWWYLKKIQLFLGVVVVLFHFVAIFAHSVAVFCSFSVVVTIKPQIPPKA